MNTVHRIQNTGDFAIYYLLFSIDYFSLASVPSVAQTTVFIGVNSWLIWKNKANLRKVEMNVISIRTRGYEQ